MNTKRILFCLVFPLVLLSACIVTRTSDPEPTQTLSPTAVPVTEPINIDPTTTDPTPGEDSGPEVIQLGDLTMEVYERILKASSDDGGFATTAGPSTEILKTRQPLRDIFSQPFSPHPLNGHQMTAALQENNGWMLVTVKLGDEDVLSVDCGAPSPITNLRGTWVINENWYVEVAHTKTEIDGNAITTDTTGEIFMNGMSLNEKYGYDETFGFQPLDDKPFYFFAKDGEIGINYADEVSMLGFESVEHYACCSGANFNPKAYLTMVTFFAQGNGKNYYVELGLFSAYDTNVMKPNARIWLTTRNRHHSRGKF